MKTTTVPASRFGWQGTTLDYVIKAEGATEVSVPENCAEGMEVRVLDSRRVGDGVEAKLRVTPLAGSYY